MSCVTCGGPLNTAGECSNWQCQTSRATPTVWREGPANNVQGCICPPTSEQTCESPTCPRQDHTHPDLQQPFKI